MLTSALNFGKRVASMAWLTGPIFGKELRVSSRRRRNYVLRFFYILLLAGFLSLFWVGEMSKGGGGGLSQVSRMAEAGKGITSFVVWFQFISAQLIAIIMLSNSISDEIYNRTLGLLMTTPINSFQIVVGKLVSKLLQIMLILGISLPPLAIIRVFGGVPWGYVVSSLCITLTTAVFAGSLSLLFSVFSRRAYAVMLGVILTLFVVFGILPWLCGLLWYLLTDSWPNPRSITIILFTNPYGVLSYTTGMMLSPMGGGMGGFAARFWYVHCGVMLAVSGVILFVAMCVVRRVALRQATGQADVAPSKKSRRRGQEAGGGSPPRRVVGPAVVWRELKAPVLGRRKLRMIISILIGGGLLVFTYGVCIHLEAFDESWTHIMYTGIYTAIGMLFTAILPATCITSEKESQSWPLLLATTLSDWEILIGKFAGVVRRCMPIWCLLFGHVIIFCLTGHIHPIAIIHIGVIVFWIVAFLSGTGLYFSSRFRHTTTAVIANFALGGVLWALAPIFTGILVRITQGSLDLYALYICSHPFVQVGVVVDAAVSSSGNYHWPGGAIGMSQSTMWLLLCAVVFALLGLLFGWLAKCRFRRAVF